MGAVLLHELLVVSNVRGNLGFVVVPIVETREIPDELRFISRDFSGGGPPENFTEQQRFDAIEAWKKWYLSIRPTAILEK